MPIGVPIINTDDEWQQFITIMPIDVPIINTNDDTTILIKDFVWISIIKDDALDPIVDVTSWCVNNAADKTTVYKYTNHIQC